MPLYYKIDILSALKERGYTTYKLRKAGLLSESTIQKLRDQKPIGWSNIEIICGLLDMQPGDLIAFEPESDGNVSAEVGEQD